MFEYVYPFSRISPPSEDIVLDSIYAYTHTCTFNLLYDFIAGVALWYPKWEQGEQGC